MTMNTLESIFNRNTTVALEEPKLEDLDIGQVSTEVPSATISSERRCEARMDARRLCPYDVIEVKEGKSVIIGKGEVFALNQSAGGMLLLMNLAPQSKQLIELRTRHSGWGWTLNILEAGWAKPEEVDSLKNLYLVGCRQVFGSCNYLSL